MNKKFQNIDNLAKEIYLQFLNKQDNLNNLPALSQKAYEYAEVWFDLQNERLKSFYSHEKNRADWYQEKIKGHALNTNQHQEKLSLIDEGKCYWVIKYGDDNNTPILAEFCNIKDHEYRFKEVNSNDNGTFPIKSILIAKND